MDTFRGSRIWQECNQVTNCTPGNTLVAGYAQEVIRVQKMSNTVSTTHFTLILCKMFLGVVVPSKSYTSAGLPQIRQAFHTLPFLIRSSWSVQYLNLKKSCVKLLWAIWWIQQFQIKKLKPGWCAPWTYKWNTHVKHNSRGAWFKQYRPGRSFWLFTCKLNLM